MTPNRVWLLLLLAIAGCGGEAGDAPAPEPPPADAAAPGAPPFLELGPLPATTASRSLPVTGRGPARGTVLAEGVAARTVADIGSDGTFCIDVRLEVGVRNRISFVAVDEHGRYSEPVERTVENVPGPPAAEPPPPTLRNIGLGGQIDLGGVILSDGEPASMVDGDLGTQTTLRNYFDHDWFGIALTSSDATIRRVRIVSSDECFPGTLTISLSAAEHPGPPSMPSPDWVVAATVEAGAAELTVDLTPEARRAARHIGFWGLSSDCGWLDWVYSYQTVREIEVWAAEPTSPPAAPEATCAGTP